jgi:hypothetical protein
LLRERSDSDTGCRRERLVLWIGDRGLVRLADWLLIRRSNWLVVQLALQLLLKWRYWLSKLKRKRRRWRSGGGMPHNSMRASILLLPRHGNLDADVRRRLLGQSAAALLKRQRLPEQRYCNLPERSLLRPDSEREQLVRGTGWELFWRDWLEQRCRRGRRGRPADRRRRTDWVSRSDYDQRDPV